MKSAGIVGASGYSGEVLVEILARHPHIERLTVASRSHAGKRVDEVLPRLAGVAGERVFTDADMDTLVKEAADVWFLALPHGVAAEYALKLLEAGRTVIDLSADFRLHSNERYAEYYGQAHPAPDWLEKTPYVLPEFSRKGWESQSLIACPGCYPTSVLLPLLPLIQEQLIPVKGIVVNSLSGVSGAGKKESLFYSFCERSENAGAYGIGHHRHLAEIEEQMEAVSDEPVRIQFTPHLVPMMRGIVTTTVVASDCPADDIRACWNRYYKGRPGVRVLPPGKTPETREVLGRNRIDMAAHTDPRTGNVVLTSAIDNLVKGAGGQAVQIMNLKMGWPELAGLS